MIFFGYVKNGPKLAKKGLKLSEMAKNDLSVKKNTKYVARHQVPIVHNGSDIWVL